MKISLKQAATILNKSEDEVLFIVQDGRLSSVIKKDDDMIFNEDGTVKFVETDDNSVDWEFDMDEVLVFKQELDASLDGTIQQILES